MSSWVCAAIRRSRVLGFPLPALLHARSWPRSVPGQFPNAQTLPGTPIRQGFPFYALAGASALVGQLSLDALLMPKLAGKDLALKATKPKHESRH
jgi:hypothetical protein